MNKNNISELTHAYEELQEEEEATPSATKIPIVKIDKAVQGTAPLTSVSHVLDNKPTKTGGSIFVCESKNNELKNNDNVDSSQQPQQSTHMTDMKLTPYWQWNDGIDLDNEKTIRLMIQLTAPAVTLRQSVSTIYVLDTKNMFRSCESAGAYMASPTHSTKEGVNDDDMDETSLNEELVNVATNSIRFACHETPVGDWFGVIFLLPNDAIETVVPLTKQNTERTVSESYFANIKTIIIESIAKKETNHTTGDLSYELLLCATVRTAIQALQSSSSSSHSESTAKQIVLITSIPSRPSDDDTLINSINSQILHTRFLADQNEITIWTLGCSPNLCAPATNLLSEKEQQDGFVEIELESESKNKIQMGLSSAVKPHAGKVHWNFLNQLSSGDWSTGVPVFTAIQNLSEFVFKFKQIYQSIHHKISCRSIMLSLSNLSSLSTNSIQLRSRAGGHVVPCPTNNTVKIKWPQLMVQETRELLLETTVDAPLTLVLKFFDGKEMKTQYGTWIPPVLRKPKLGFYLRQKNSVYTISELQAYASQLLRRFTLTNTKSDVEKLRSWVELLRVQTSSVEEHPRLQRILKCVLWAIQILSNSKQECVSEIIPIWGRFIACGSENNYFDSLSPRNQFFKTINNMRSIYY